MKRSYTILYVDDDIDDLHLISDAFEKYTDHLTVVHACNGLEGLETLEKMHKAGSLPCLVTIDINMPVMDGKQMLEKLRAHYLFRELPVILFSTSNSEKDQQFAERHDAELIPKPAKYSQLKSLVSEFVSKCKIEVKRTV